MLYFNFCAVALPTCSSENCFLERSAVPIKNSISETTSSLCPIFQTWTRGLKWSHAVDLSTALVVSFVSWSWTKTGTLGNGQWDDMLTQNQTHRKTCSRAQHPPWPVPPSAGISRGPHRHLWGTTGGSLSHDDKRVPVTLTPWAVGVSPAAVGPGGEWTSHRVSRASERWAARGALRSGLSPLLGEPWGKPHAGTWPLRARHSFFNFTESESRELFY